MKSCSANLERVLEVQCPYSRGAVANYLRLSEQMIAGSLLKLLPTMGDRFAISCSMEIAEADISNPRVVERICYGIRFVFTHLDETIGEQDAYPWYSCFFLEKLLDRTSSGASRDLIEEVLGLCRNELLRRVSASKSP